MRKKIKRKEENKDDSTYENEQKVKKYQNDENAIFSSGEDLFWRKSHLNVVNIVEILYFKK